MINLDGPEHEIVRSLVARPLARPVVAPNREVIEHHVTRLVDTVDPCDTVDIISAIAYRCRSR